MNERIGAEHEGFTGKNLFANAGEELQVDERRDDAFQRPKLWIDAQREKH